MHSNRKEKTQGEEKKDNSLFKEDHLSSLHLKDIIDIKEIQKLMEEFNTLTGYNVAIVDHQGKLMVATGGEEICVKYHRAHPETRKYCRESDIYLCQGVSPGEYKIYRCKNHLWDMATPIVVEGKHIGNILTGQFFFDDEEVDYEFFRAQARKNGFDEEEYLNALDRVPCRRRETVNNLMSYYTRLARVISLLGQRNLNTSLMLTERDRLLESYRESESRNRALLEALPDLILAFNKEGFIIDYSVSSFNSLMELTEEYLNKHAREVLPRELGESISIRLPELFSEGKIQHFEYHREAGDKESSYYEVRLVLSNEERALAIIRDITEPERAKEELRESKEKYREILAGIEEAYYESNLAGNMVYCNEAACRILGYDPTGLSYREIYSDPEKVYRTFNQVYRSGEPNRGFVLGVVRGDGSMGYCEISITPIRDKKGIITGFRGLARDITERIQYENQLKYLSFHDQLTGLYNRAYFEEELKRLESSREYPVTIISADLDGLKLINDTMGHYTGDKMLKAAAEVLKISLREGDFLARVGGDEFAIILCRCDISSAEEVMERIRINTDYYNRKNPELLLSLSLGVATADTRGSSLVELFKQADDLMYQDKLYRSSGSRKRIVDTLLATLDERDFITGGHAQRLTRYCQKIGEKAGLFSRQISNLALLSQVHDLGKVGVPDHILFKEGPLNDEEWKIMKQHPEKGYRIALSSSELSVVADLILKHHERWDGKGYPLGIKGRDIPIECRIMAIVDAYDAMTSDRPYRKAMSREDAVAELKRCAGTQFDPDLVDMFISLLEEEQ